jgi:hypothetical protein
MMHPHRKTACTVGDDDNNVVDMFVMPIWSETTKINTTKTKRSKSAKVLVNLSC